MMEKGGKRYINLKDKVIHNITRLQYNCRYTILSARQNTILHFWVIVYVIEMCAIILKLARFYIPLTLVKDLLPKS